MLILDAKGLRTINHLKTSGGYTVGFGGGNTFSEAKLIACPPVQTRENLFYGNCGGTFRTLTRETGTPYYYTLRIKLLLLAHPGENRPIVFQLLRYKYTFTRRAIFGKSK